ncbi:LytTR family DNA-binding domain-containing protein [Bradyrhizobium sp. SRS-191]|uniref:LytTR family DNA-binding domain-containing protein n=1 Tax=Bradyrhizobium sp. SRS-191 TaxID=2962606 RepID=UPI00211F1DB0|nr:LytTR family DNA-binding domain-containing protein [Bradyrhizobium sp. SRS-191]
MSETKPDRDAATIEPARDEAGSPRDETQPSGTSGGRRGISGDAAMFGAIAAIAVAIGIVNALSAAQDAARRGEPPDPGRLVFWELSSIAVILLAMPILVMAIRRAREMSHWWPRIAIAVLAVASFSTLHIAGMVWLRKLALWAIGSSYDFNLSFATLLYEFRKDSITAALIGGTVWLADGRREVIALRRRETEPPLSVTPRQLPQSIWLRDGTSRIRVHPREILWVSSAGNYIEYRLGDRTEHLIRGTLAAAEAELGVYRIVRVHRTKLANLDRVTAVEFKPSGDFDLVFDTGQSLQGSRRYRAAVAALARPAAPS